MKILLGKNKFIIHSMIIIFLMFGFGFIPPVAPLTKMGMQVIGVLLGFIYGWSVIGLIWPSMLGLAAIAIQGIMPMTQIVAKGFGSETTVVLILFFIFSALIDERGVSRKIALLLVSKKVFCGRPWLFTFVFLCIAAALSAATSATAATILCFGLFYMIANTLGYKKEHKWTAFMLLGITFSTCLGMAMFPFKAVSITLLGVYQQLSGIAIPFGRYILFYMPLCVVCILAYVAIGKCLLNIDVSLLQNLNENSFGKECTEPFSKMQKAIVFFLFLLIFLLVLPGLLPQDTILKNILSKLSSVGIVMFVMALMCCIKIDGQPILNFSHTAKEGVIWDVVWLVAAIMPMVTIFTMEETGIKAFITTFLAPLFVGKTPIFFLIVVTILSILLSNVCHQGVIGILFLTICYDIALQIDASTVLLLLLINIAVHPAILTPAASSMAAVLYSNKDWIEPKDIYKYGGIAIFSTAILIVLFGIPYAKFLF